MEKYSHQHWLARHCWCGYWGLWRQPVLTTLLQFPQDEAQSRRFSRIAFPPHQQWTLPFRWATGTVLLSFSPSSLSFDCVQSVSCPVPAPPPPRPTHFLHLPWFYTLRTLHVPRVALLRSLAPSQREFSCFWFLHLPETTCIPWVLALPPYCKSAVMGQVLFTLHLDGPLSVFTYPAGHTLERFSTWGNWCI